MSFSWVSSLCLGDAQLYSVWGFSRATAGSRWAKDQDREREKERERELAHVNISYIAGERFLPLIMAFRKLRVIIDRPRSTFFFFFLVVLDMYSS